MHITSIQLLKAGESFVILNNDETPERFVIMDTKEDIVAVSLRTGKMQKVTANTPVLALGTQDGPLHVWYGTGGTLQCDEHPKSIKYIGVLNPEQIQEMYKAIEEANDILNSGYLDGFQQEDLSEAEDTVARLETRARHNATGIAPTTESRVDDFAHVAPIDALREWLDEAMSNCDVLKEYEMLTVEENVQAVLENKKPILPTPQESLVQQLDWFGKYLKLMAKNNRLRSGKPRVHPQYSDFPHSAWTGPTDIGSYERWHLADGMCTIGKVFCICLKKDRWVWLCTGPEGSSHGTTIGCTDAIANANAAIEELIQNQLGL